MICNRGVPRAKEQAGEDSSSPDSLERGRGKPRVLFVNLSWVLISRRTISLYLLTHGNPGFSHPCPPTFAPIRAAYLTACAGMRMPVHKPWTPGHECRRD
jgi:hypothetical protein